MKRAVTVVLVGVLVGGCAHGLPPHSLASAPAACPKVDAAGEVQLGLVRQMLEQDRAYAGLAHLEALSPAVRSSAEAVHLQAELLRHTGDTQAAERRYRELLGGCLAGRGHHGLGLLAAQHDLKRAVTELRQAARLLPTDARIRNDYGYVLLLSREAAAARREFLTAIELGDHRQRAALNLLLLTLYEGDETDANRLRKRMQLTDTGWDQLRRQAQQLRIEPIMHSDGEG